MKLLLVEDDPELASVVREGLAADGHVIETTSRALEAEAMIELGGYALVVLDVRLPEGEDAGYELAARLRDRNDATPILYLTARDDVADIERGLEQGGDDYLVKPFAFRELRARVRALLRRSGGSASASTRRPLPAGWTLDLNGREAYRGRRAARLTQREYALLELLALHPERVFTRDELIDRLWPGDAEVSLKIIDIYVSNLRRKLGRVLIATFRGTGYRLGDVGAEPEGP